MYVCVRVVIKCIYLALWASQSLVLGVNAF